MRTIFSVAAKLLGVHFAYLGLIYLINTVLFADGGDEAAFVQLLQAGLAAVFAFVLVVRTDQLAQLVGVSSEASTSISGLEPKAALRTGIVLIGLFVFLTRLGSVLQTAALHLGGTRFGGIGGAPVRFLIECVPLALAVVFVFRADRVADLIAREKAPAG